jgi:hypothetical protein
MGRRGGLKNRWETVGVQVPLCAPCIVGEMGTRRSAKPSLSGFDSHTILQVLPGWWNGRHTSLRGWRESVGVQVPFRAPNCTTVVEQADTSRLLEIAGRAGATPVSRTKDVGAWWNGIHTGLRNQRLVHESSSLSAPTKVMPMWWNWNTHRPQKAAREHRGSKPLIGTKFYGALAESGLRHLTANEA